MLTTEDREYIAAFHPEYLTYDDKERDALTDALIHNAKRQELDRAINAELTIGAVQQAYENNRYFYAFAQPQERDKAGNPLKRLLGKAPSKDGKGSEIYEEIPSITHIVPRDLLADWCRDNRLDLANIQTVGLGESPEYRGWGRAQGAALLTKVETGPGAMDFMYVAPKGVQIGQAYIQAHHGGEQWAAQVLADRAKDAPAPFHVNQAKFYEVRVYGQEAS